MTRHALAVVAALVVLLLASAIWPARGKSDVPVAASPIPASDFVPIGTRLVPGVAQSAERRLKPEVAGAEPVSGARASRQPRTPSPTLPTNVGLDKAATGPAIFKGMASWFDSPIGVSAAGPALRAAEECPVNVFPAVCGALSLGLCTAEVTW